MTLHTDAVNKDQSASILSACIKRIGWTPEFKFVVVGFCSVMMLGCAAPKPSFIDPVPVVPAEWSTVIETSTSADASRQPWWQTLKSPALDQLVEEALAENTSVKRAVKAVELANQQLETVKLGWLPSLNLFGGRISGDTTLFFQGLPVPVSNVGGFVGILPNYFVNMFRLPYEQRQAMELVDVARAEMLAVRAGVVGEVVSAYAILLSSSNEMNLLEKVRQTLIRQRDLVAGLESVGMASKTMLNQIAVEIAQVDGQMALLRANAVAARNALNTLVKRPLGTREPFDTVEALVIVDPVTSQTPAAVLNFRPDIVAERARVLAATTGIDVETMLLAPTFEFNALRTNIDTQVNDLGGQSNANFTAGYAALTLDPRVFGLIKTSELSAEDALLRYVETVDRALREVDDAIAQFQGQRRNLETTQEQVSILKRNVDELTALEKSQLASELSVLEATLEWLVARLSHTEAQTQTLLAYVGLQQAMGIGVLYETENLTIVNGLIETPNHEEIP